MGILTRLGHSSIRDYFVLNPMSHEALHQPEELPSHLILLPSWPAASRASWGSLEQDRALNGQWYLCPELRTLCAIGHTMGAFRSQFLWFLCFSHRFLISLISSMQVIHANSLGSVNSSLSFRVAILLLAGFPFLGPL